MLIIAAVCAVVVTGLGIFGLSLLNSKVIDLKDKEKEILYIPTGSEFEDVVQLLNLDGWLCDESKLRTFAGLKNYTSNVKAGRYEIRNGMTANELINLLRSGNQLPVNVTFNNVRTMPQLASYIARNLEADSVEIVKVLTDEDIMERYGYRAETFPAMFIPNTYQFMWTTTPEKFVERMNKEYEKFWNDYRKHKADSLQMAPIEISIIASIIEEETNKKDELPIIAGIYINRIRKHMPLQACPTLKYALGDFTLHRILKKDMEVESPYNTYKYAGLPPGPIRIPSITAIDAVLNATDHEYLFMCARPDGSGRHNFARTNAEHARNAATYQQELNKRKIYR